MELMGIMSSTNRETVHATRALAARERGKTRALWAWLVALCVLNAAIVVRVVWHGRIL